MTVYDFAPYAVAAGIELLSPLTHKAGLNAAFRWVNPSEEARREVQEVAEYSFDFIEWIATLLLNTTSFLILLFVRVPPVDVKFALGAFVALAVIGAMYFPLVSTKAHKDLTKGFSLFSVINLCVNAYLAYVYLSVT